MAVINGLLFGIFLISALLMTLLVLFRPSEAGGLGGVFGGGTQDMAFGVKTTKIVDKIILGLAIIFLLCAILVTMTSSHHIEKSATETTEGSNQ